MGAAASAPARCPARRPAARPAPPPGAPATARCARLLRAARPLHAVGPAVRLRVEAGVRDGGEPADGRSGRVAAPGQLGSAEVDRSDLPGLEERDRVEPVAAIETEVTGEVVAGTGGHDA